MTISITDPEPADARATLARDGAPSTITGANAGPSPPVPGAADWPATRRHPNNCCGVSPVVARNRRHRLAVRVALRKRSATSAQPSGLETHSKPHHQFGDPFLKD